MWGEVRISSLTDRHYWTNKIESARVKLYCPKQKCLLIPVLGSPWKYKYNINAPTYDSRCCPQRMSRTEPTYLCLVVRQINGGDGPTPGRRSSSTAPSWPWPGLHRRPPWLREMIHHHHNPHDTSTYVTSTHDTSTRHIHPVAHPRHIQPSSHSLPREIHPRFHTLPPHYTQAGTSSLK